LAFPGNVLRVRPESTRMEHLKGAPILGRLLDLPTNITPGWKGLSVTNTLAYYETFVNYDRKQFYNIDTRNGRITDRGFRNMPPPHDASKTTTTTTTTATTIPTLKSSTKSPTLTGRTGSFIGLKRTTETCQVIILYREY
jgi:hypothetical protein